MGRRAVILVAGGTGTRMRSKTAKQFLLLHGKPIILYTFAAFQRFDPEMQFVLVLHESLVQDWEAITLKYKFDLPHTVVKGGAERFHSVQNGLASLASDIEMVAIHDAVRPLVSLDTIGRCFDAASLHGAAVPAVALTDTVRRIEKETSRTLPRHELFAVQTPQCFRREVIESAYKVTFRQHFTDDASVAENSGFPIFLAEGNRTNIKITTPEDLSIAEAIIERK